ncbi:AAA family ATPase [Nocardia nova]|uniref:AAA family ATPase n=1 Tax=Nocardia nova TaxID=37330 RepID=UPI0015E37484
MFGDADGEGYIAVSFGINDTDKTGKPVNRPAYVTTYPNNVGGRRDLIQAVNKAGAGQNIFLNGVLRSKAATGDQVTISQLPFHCARSVWCDADDEGKVNIEAVEKLKANGGYLETQSGRGVHHRAAIETITDRDEFCQLNYHFAQAIGGGDEGHSKNENFWLTVPWSTRYKREYYPPGVEFTDFPLEHGRRIRTVSFDARHTWSKEGLARKLSAYCDAPEVSPRSSVKDVSTEPWDADKSAALWRRVPDDVRTPYEDACEGHRNFSTGIYAFWKECFKAGFDIDRVFQMSWHDPHQRIGDRWKYNTGRIMDQIENAKRDIEKEEAPGATKSEDLNQSRKEKNDEDDIITSKLADEFGIDPDILQRAKTQALSSSFILDAPEAVPALWGNDGEKVWWSPGEALLLNAATGAGKTTLAGLLVRARMGYAESVAGYPVKPGRGKVLYLAMDRPAQAQRSLRRQLGDLTAEQLDSRLVVLSGPPIASFVVNTMLLLALARSFDADTVIVDSLKDAVIKLSDEEMGHNWNRAVMNCCNSGVEVIVLHHNRKSNGDNADKPRGIDDVYGSNWLTAGAGSVLSLSRVDERVEIHQLKGPMGEGDKLKLKYSKHTGEMLTDDEFKERQMTVEDKVREYLKEHPDASKRNVRKNVPGSNGEKDAAYDKFHTTEELFDEEL